MKNQAFIQGGMNIVTGSIGMWRASNPGLSSPSRGDVTTLKFADLEEGGRLPHSGRVVRYTESGSLDHSTNKQGSRRRRDWSQGGRAHWRGSRLNPEHTRTAGEALEDGTVAKALPDVLEAHFSPRFQ